tara:strand:- start:56 stop:250 length:195 start_codon:yes stop_codon:yes gene_type:complete
MQIKLTQNYIDRLDQSIAETEAMISKESGYMPHNQNPELIASCDEHIAKLKEIKSKGIGATVEV